MNTATKLMLAGMLAALLGSGCAINGIQHVEQPEAAAPGTQIDVYVLGTYYVMSQDSVFTEPWVRDKMLISTYLPAGWTVNSVACHVDTAGYRTMQRYMAGDSINTEGIDYAHVMDSLSAISKSPSATSAYDATLGTLFPAGSRVMHSFLLNDPVTLPAGTRADTVVEDTSGMVDSLNMKLVTYYLHFNLTTGTVEDTFMNAYFTSFMPDSMSSQSFATENAISDSNIIVISSNVIVTGSGAARALPVMPVFSRHPLGSTDRITLNVPVDLAGTRAHLTLYAPDGRPYGSTFITAAAGHNTFSLSDVTDRSLLDAGTYILRIRMDGQEYQRQVIVK